jgi:hypothetical protein
MNSTHHGYAGTMEDPPFYYVWDGMLISVLMLWTLVGLWIWLSYADRASRRGAFNVPVGLLMGCFCGPGAFVAALWTVRCRRDGTSLGKAISRRRLEVPSNYWKN